VKWLLLVKGVAKREVSYPYWDGRGGHYERVFHWEATCMDNYDRGRGGARDREEEREKKKKVYAREWKKIQKERNEKATNTANNQISKIK
jgi:hypothetical protein